MKFATAAALVLSSLASVHAQQTDKDIIKDVSTCDPLVYADGYIYKSNDRTLKGMPAQNAFPVHLYVDDWNGYSTANQMRLVRVDRGSYDERFHLTRFEDSMTIPFEGKGPVTFKHKSKLAAGERQAAWSFDYGNIRYSETPDRSNQPSGGGFLWEDVPGYDLQQLFWDRPTYDRAAADHSIQWGNMEVMCKGIRTDAWNGEIEDQISV